MKPRSKDRLMKMSELCEFLGVVPSTIYRWLESGQFPQPFDIGQDTVRWRLSEIEKWLEESRR